MNILGISSLSPFGNSSSVSNKSGSEKNSPESFADLLSKMSESKQQASTVAPTSGGSGLEGEHPDIENTYHEKLQLLREKVEQIVEQLGINTTGSPLTMHLNAKGEVIVSGEHAQMADLQKAIENDPVLKNLFTQVANLAEKMAKTQNPDGMRTLLDSSNPDSLNSINLPERFSLKIDGMITEPSIG